MSSKRIGMAKGLKELCPPYRNAWFYDAQVDSQSASGWNCPPALWDQVTTLDMSGVTYGNEALIALLSLEDATGGIYTLALDWYLERNNRRCYWFSYTKEIAAGGWLYAYCGLGYGGQEITENGNYRVEYKISGPESWSYTQVLTVTGVKEEKPPPTPAPSGFMAAIEQLLVSIAGQLYAAHLEVKGWIWPFHLLSGFLYWASEYFLDIADAWVTFAEWVAWVSENIGGIIDWEKLRDTILSWFPGLDDIISWFTDWWDKVLAVIETWWEPVSHTVVGWISAATQGFDELREDWLEFWNNLWPEVLSHVNILVTNWTDFVTKTLPDLVNFAWLANWWTSRLQDIQSLIDTAFTLRAGLWEGWQELKDQVIGFFTDPWGWLYNRLDDFIERYW